MNLYTLFTRIVFPALVLLWIFVIIAFKGDGKVSLRGATLTVDHLLRKEATELEPHSNSVTLDHLVIVPGHAVLRFDQFQSADTMDSSWYLLEYQRNQGFPQIIDAHIKSAIDVLIHDPSTILVFSGGQTRKDVGPYSEALSYYFLAHYKQWLPSDSQLESRVALEEYARDSFENLLFSIARFKEITGHYPRKITVVGFDFKKHRFSTLHRKALQFPENNFSYLGVHSPAVTPLFDQSHAENGEAVAVKEFEHDFYGCQDAELKEKRRKRDPFHRSIPYELSCPEMSELLHFCGPDIIESSHVPWMNPLQNIANL